MEYNSYDFEWASGFDEIIDYLGGTAPDDEEVFDFMCETKNDISTNAYYELALSQIQSLMEDEHPDLSVEYYVNARDTHLTIEGEEVRDVNDLKEILKEKLEEEKGELEWEIEKKQGRSEAYFTSDELREMEDRISELQEEIDNFAKGGETEEDDFPSEDEERLADEHIKEAKRGKAEITNMGWGSGPDFIESKTDKGILYSEIEDGKVSHEWEYEEEEYEKGGVMADGKVELASSYGVGEKKDTIYKLIKDDRYGYFGEGKPYYKIIEIPNPNAETPLPFVIHMEEDFREMNDKYKSYTGKFAKGGLLETLPPKQARDILSKSDLFNEFMQAPDEVTQESILQNAQKIVKSGVYAKGGKLYDIMEYPSGSDFTVDEEDFKKLKSKKLIYADDETGWACNEDDYEEISELIGQEYAKGGLIASESQWKEYRAVQDGGYYNMFDPRAREMTSMSKEEYMDIIKNYGEYEKKYGRDSDYDVEEEIVEVKRPTLKKKYAKGGEVKEIKLEIEKLKKENPEGFKEEIELLEEILKLKKEKPEGFKEEIEFQQQRLDYIMGFSNRTPKDFKLGELVYDTRNKTYGTIIGIYDNSSWEVRLDSDGMQPTEYLRKLGEDGDKGTKKQLFEGVSSIERLRREYPENNYPKLINNPFYAKGGEVDNVRIIEGRYNSSEDIAEYNNLEDWSYNKIGVFHSSSWDEEIHSLLEGTNYEAEIVENFYTHRGKEGELDLNNSYAMVREKGEYAKGGRLTYDKMESLIEEIDKPKWEKSFIKKIKSHPKVKKVGLDNDFFANTYEITWNTGEKWNELGMTSMGLFFEGQDYMALALKRTDIGVLPTGDEYENIKQVKMNKFDYSSGETLTQSIYDYIPEILKSTERKVRKLKRYGDDYAKGGDLENPWHTGENPYDSDYTGGKKDKYDEPTGEYDVRYIGEYSMDEETLKLKEKELIEFAKEFDYEGNNLEEAKEYIREKGWSITPRIKSDDLRGYAKGGKTKTRYFLMQDYHPTDEGPSGTWREPTGDFFYESAKNMADAKKIAKEIEKEEEGKIKIIKEITDGTSLKSISEGRYKPDLWEFYEEEDELGPFYAKGGKTKTRYFLMKEDNEIFYTEATDMDDAKDVASMWNADIIKEITDKKQIAKIKKGTYNPHLDLAGYAKGGKTKIDKTIYLESVNAFINTRTLIISLPNASEIHLDDVNDSWFASLSDYDFGTISNLINKKDMKFAKGGEVKDIIEDKDKYGTDGYKVFAVVDNFDYENQDYDQLYYKTDNEEEIKDILEEYKKFGEYVEGMEVIEVMSDGRMIKYRTYDIISRVGKFAKGGKTLSEDELWDMIESYDWIEDGDYKRIGKKVKKLSKDKYKQLLGFAKAKHQQLDNKYRKGIQGYVSDDGWDDVRAEVVGLGKDYYNNITIKKLQDMSNGGYTENFLYSFQDHKSWDNYGSSDDMVKYEEIWY